MLLPLGSREWAELVLASRFDADPVVRRRSGWVLSLARGVPLARVARASGVSRPTVYRAALLYRRFRTPRALSVGFLPWRRRVAIVA